MKNKSKIILISTILAAGIAVFFMGRYIKNQKILAVVAGQATYTVAEIDIPLTTSASGTLFPKESKIVYPETQGKVIAIYKAEGQTVKKNEVVVKLDPKFQDNLLALAASRYKLAQISTKLAQKTFVSVNDLPKATPGYKDNKEKAQLQLDASKEQEKQALLALEAQEMLSASFYIKAPFAGTLISMDLAVGDMVSPQMPVFKVSNNNAWVVAAYIDESGILNIKNNMVAEVTLDSISNKKFSGFVSYVSKDLGVSPEGLKAYKIEITLDNFRDFVIEGISANLTIDIGTAKNVIAVPSEALLIDGDNEYVFLKKNNAVIKTKVTTGAEGNGFVEITEGLKLKDIILRTPLSDSTAALTQEIMSASPLK